MATTSCEYGGHLALMAATLEEVHGSGDRVSLWEICCWHAAARADEIVVRCADGSVVGYVRDPTEDLVTFARRLTARLEPDRGWDEDAANRSDFAAVLTGDIAVRSGAEIYALHPHLLDPRQPHADRRSAPPGRAGSGHQSPRAAARLSAQPQPRSRSQVAKSLRTE